MKTPKPLILPPITLEPGDVFLGMDPAATKNCGWAAIRYSGPGKVDLLAKFTQVIDRPAETIDVARLRDIYDNLAGSIALHKPRLLCLERSTGGGLMFVRSNLSEVVGVAKLCCHDHKILVHETSPAHLKKVITGSGKAKKKHIKANVVAWFGLKRPGPEHECDAVAIALSTMIDLGFSGYAAKVPCDLSS